MKEMMISAARNDFVPRNYVSREGMVVMWMGLISSVLHLQHSTIKLLCAFSPIFIESLYRMAVIAIYISEQTSPEPSYFTGGWYIALNTYH